jgi:hypothetical protein
MSPNDLAEALRVMKLDREVEVLFRAAAAGLAGASKHDPAKVTDIGTPPDPVTEAEAEAQPKSEAEPDATTVQEPEPETETETEPEAPAPAPPTVVSRAEFQASERQFLAALDAVAAKCKDALDDTAKATATTCNNPAVRDWAEVFGTFRPRQDREIWYRIIGVKVHGSETCLVIFAEEIKRKKDDTAGAKSVQPLVKQYVCLKLMSHEDQWKREIDMRKLNGDKQLSDKHVVPLLDHFVLDGLAFVETDERLHGEATWTHLLSMPRAERDLSDLLSHDRVAGHDLPEVTKILRQVAAHLEYFHETCGRIHGPDISHLDIPLLDHDLCLDEFFST